CMLALLAGATYCMFAPAGPHRTPPLEKATAPAPAQGDPVRAAKPREVAPNVKPAPSPAQQKPGMVLVAGGVVEIDSVRTSVAAFWVDQAKVTIADYYAWARRGNKRLPFGDNNQYPGEHPNDSVWNVSQPDAAGFCVDHGKHLLGE